MKTVLLMGLDVFTGKLADMKEAGVIEPLNVLKHKLLKLLVKQLK